MTTPQLPEGAPAVPPKVRTVTYYVGLGVGAATILATGITAAVAPGAAVKVLAVCGAFTAATSFVCGGLGAIFRPPSLPGSGR